MKDTAKVVDISCYIGVVGAISLFVDGKRPFIAFSSPRKVSKVLKDTAKVVDHCCYIWMAGAISLFADGKCPLKTFSSRGEISKAMKGIILQPSCFETISD